MFEVMTFVLGGGLSRGLSPARFLEESVLM